MWTLIIITLIGDAQYGATPTGGAAVNSQIGTVNNFSSFELCDQARKDLSGEVNKGPELHPPDGSVGLGVGNTRYRIITICAHNS
jgi:hypothetical protein